MSFKIIVFVAAVFAFQANAQFTNGALTPFLIGARNGIADVARPIYELGSNILGQATGMLSSGGFPQIPHLMSSVQGMIPHGLGGSLAGMIPGGANFGQMLNPGAFPSQMPLPLGLGGSDFLGGMGAGIIPPSVSSAINGKLNGISGMLPSGLPFPNGQAQASGQVSANGQSLPGLNGFPSANGISGMIPQGGSFPNFQGQASGQASGQMSGSTRPQIGSGSGVSPSALTSALSEATKGPSGSLISRYGGMGTNDYSVDIPYGGPTPLNLQANGVPTPNLLKPDLRE